MPLSEDEQRILQEIERNFYESDPAFAREVSSRTLFRHAGRNIRWAVLGFVVGLAVLVFSFATSLIIGSLGFVLMLASAWFFERNFRKVGRASIQQVATSVRAGGLGERGRRLRQRFKKPE
ncbi:MAG: DUF3040 domain-containing protein [Acidimicrobiales bacterium]